MAYDIEHAPAGAWPRLAVVTKVDEWSHQALDTVRKFSTDVIQLQTDEEKRIETELPRKMTELTGIAV
jgi:hypothetical protein